MVTVCIRYCAECGAAAFEHGEGVKLYGNGAARCRPKCVRKFERRLNKRWGTGGRFRKAG